MAADKYLQHDGAGGLKETALKQTSAGAGDAGKGIALNSNGQLDPTMLPPEAGAADNKVITASEDLVAGDFVNVWNSTGAKARKADASTAAAAKKAHGYVKANVTSGQPATVWFEGTNDAVTGLTPGDVFLSDSTPGASTGTAPTTSAHIVQRLGVAVSATAINVEFGPPIILA